MYKKLLIVLNVLVICGFTGTAFGGDDLYDHLIAYYPLDGNMHNNVGADANAPNGGITFTTDAQRGQVAYFGGTDAPSSPALNSYTQGTFMNCSSVINSNINGNFTISFWAKSDPASKSTQGIVTMFSGYNAYVASGGTIATPVAQLSGYYCSGSPPSAIFTQYPSSTRTYPWSAMMQSGTYGNWHHWVFQKFGPGNLESTWPELRLWIDKVYVGAISNTANMVTVDNLRIGINNRSAFKGYLDNVAIWDWTLNGSQITALYNTGFPPLLFAANPIPTDGAKDVDPVVTLKWASGPQAVSHDVYLGTNQTTVTNATVSMPMGVFLGNQTAKSKSVTLKPLTTYYWRIDEHNNDATIKRRSVWSFTTRSYAVDNFESYASDSALQAKWAATNATIVVEKNITHEYSAQAMKLSYNTAVNPYYSKVVYDLGTAQDWTLNLMKILAVYFHGSTNNVSERIYATVEDSAAHAVTVTYPYPEDLTQSDLSARWNEWNINLQTLATGGVNLASVKKVTIGVGDGTPGGSSGTIYIDDVQLYQQRCVEEYGPAGDLNGDCRVDINDVLILAQDWLLKGEGDVTAATPNSAGLVAHYAFNETSGSTAADSSGHGNNATVNPSNAWNSQGKFGGCLNFTGDYNTGAIVLVPDSAFSGITNKITISVWANADTSGYTKMTIFDSNGSSAGLWPEPKWEGTLGFVADGEGAFWAKAQPQDYKGAWHHYALVKDAGKGIQRLYYDGEVVAENPYVEVLPAGIKNFIVGRSYTTDSRYGTDAFVGKLDDLKIYNYALSQAEILNLAQVASFHQRVVSDADVYEDSNNEAIDFRDFAAIAKKWLQSQLWP